LILRKIIKIVATRCQISRLKCTKFDFGWQQLDFMGLLLRRGAKGGEEKGRGRKRKWKEEEGEKGKKGGKGSPWASDSQKQIFWLRRCSFIHKEMEAVVAYIK